MIRVFWYRRFMLPFTCRKNRFESPLSTSYGWFAEW